MPFPSDEGFTRVGAGTSAAFVCEGEAGLSSTAECLPLVQGGMERNSSKVRTRGLQHFQPNSYSQPLEICLHRAWDQMWERGHLSALRGRLEAQGDRHTLLLLTQMFCRSLCARIWRPLLKFCDFVINGLGCKIKKYQFIQWMHLMRVDM